MINLNIKRKESSKLLREMKTGLLLAVCYIALTGVCFAQDIIVTKDSKKIEANVTEVNVDNVRYKNFHNPDGPVYTLSKSDIVTIIYQNGQVETFETARSTPVTSTQTAPASAQTTKVSASGVTQPARNINMVNEMRVNYPALYSQYASGRRMKTAGGVMTGVGIGSFILGIAVMAVGVEEDDDDMIGGGAVIFTAGTVLMAVGIPVLAVGGGKQRRAIREFNRQYYSAQSPSPYFQLKLHPNRMGLAYVF